VDDFVVADWDVLKDPAEESNFKRFFCELQSADFTFRSFVDYLLVRMPGRNIVARTWPNDYNIIQQPQMLHDKFDHFQIWANNTQHVAARRNRVAKRAQLVAPNNVAICCVEVLWSFGRA